MNKDERLNIIRKMVDYVIDSMTWDFHGEVSYKIYWSPNVDTNIHIDISHDDKFKFRTIVPLKMDYETIEYGFKAAMQLNILNKK